MERSDEELLAAYLGGEESAFGELTARHLKGVYSFVLKFVGGQHEAEDIAQESFLKVWKNLQNFRPEKSSFKKWLLRIARNSSIDFLRKKKHIPFSEFEKDGEHTLAETVPAPDALPYELWEQAENSAALTEALQELTPRHREILLLYYTNDLTFDEIGAMLGEP